MNFLVIGIGSIGRRHAINLKEIGHRVIVCDIDKNRLNSFAKKNNFVSYSDYLEAIKHEKIEGAIIATPSNFHISPAIELANSGINIFMEKPLSINLENINKLQKIIEEKKIIFMMGQSYRFHEGLICLKKYIDEGAIGKIYNVEMSGGWYLPDWHYKEDYRKEYAARSELGGGVLFTSLSHSIDTTRWLFGEIINIKGWKAKLSELDLDVDDYVSCSLLTENRIVVNILDDFISRFPRNQIKVFGSEGFVVTKFEKKEIHLWRVKNKRFIPDKDNLDPNYNYFKILEDGIHYDSKMDVKSFDFDINKRYQDEIKFFSKKIKKNDKDFSPNFFDGKKTLEILTSNKIEMI